MATGSNPVPPIKKPPGKGVWGKGSRGRDLRKAKVLEWLGERQERLTEGKTIGLEGRTRGEAEGLGVVGRESLWKNEK